MININTSHLLRQKSYVALGISLMVLSACSGTTSIPGQSDSPVSESIPTSTPTANPTATPSSTPIPSPSPTPTVNPSPSPTPTAKVYNGPAEVEKYVTKFIADALIQKVDVLPDMKSPMLEIRIASLDAYGSSVIGLCETGGNLRRVTFDPDFWNSVSETQKGLLTHHELGHCVLYRPHRSDLLSSGAYASIMYPIIMSSTTYTKNAAYYLEELFSWNTLQLSGAEKDEVKTHICDLNEL